MFGQRPYSIDLQNVGARVGKVYNFGPMAQHGFFGTIRSSAASNHFHDVEARCYARTARFLLERNYHLLRCCLETSDSVKKFLDIRILDLYHFVDVSSTAPIPGVYALCRHLLDLCLNGYSSRSDRFAKLVLFVIANFMVHPGLPWVTACLEMRQTLQKPESATKAVFSFKECCLSPSFFTDFPRSPEESHLCIVEVISKKNGNETSMIVKLSIRDPDLVKVIQEISDRDPTLLNLHFLSDKKSELIVKCAVD